MGSRLNYPVGLCRALVAFVGFVLIGCGAGGTTQEVDPSSSADLELAMVALQRGDYSQAMALVDRVEERQARLTEASFVRGQIYFDLQMYQEARNAWERVRDNEPEYWLWWHNLGDVSYKQQRYDEAVRQYRRAAELDPNPLSLHGLASAYLELGQTDSTRQILTRAAEIDSLYAAAHISLATLAEEEGDLETALGHAERAFTLDTTAVASALKAGTILVRLGEYERALPHLERVLVEDPSDHAALYNYGQALQRLGRPEAGEVLEMAEAVRAQERSLQLLRDAVANNPTNPANQLALAEALHQSGRLADALRAYKAVDLLAPDNQALEHTIATLHLELGEPAIAAMRYVRLLESDSTFVEAWLNLGLAYARMDSMQHATAVWRTAGRRFPDHPAVQQVMSRIGS